MRDELQKSLRERYPLIFGAAPGHRDPFGPVLGPFPVWGFECGDGWFDLLDALALNLQYATKSAGAPQVVAAQVKEKFGRLCFYTDGADARQRAMIELAETMSSRICEVCGNRGTLTSANGWMMTRCPAHAAGSEE
ncbi:hypothetical protein G3N59_11660 [Paraburkholderia sp. Ac-20340]|uniref:hypothetical protein n=1 Tax=Paraburkholderia sp. Ac-20340 TaxID=2703888 RepID=UPI00197FA2DF|nr:hypothetical protein [Paraburkholderia sp. Ac-20340]MBN3854036.1 hypothetical protein [Paraburkholderia sp. Ac-20340]